MSPPSGDAHRHSRPPHLHKGHESAIFIQSGQVEVRHGEGLTEHVVLGAGDYIHIPANTPHLPVNTGDQDMVCLVARTDPNEQEGVRLLDLPAWLESRVGPLVAGAG
ncbi:cupin domain-containing protein [Streptomyces sp. NPDC003036]|uniref:cupin domain-containing protein n=1 Tax=Streptomyces sp. NPDC003036 TaxID=3154442 RepID=UPI00339E551A